MKERYEDKKITETLDGLIKELKEECETFTKLANRLEREDLTEEQVEELIGEIMASVVSSKFIQNMSKKNYTVRIMTDSF